MPADDRLGRTGARRSTATYKGTNPSDALSVASGQASQPVCTTGSTTTPPTKPCRCLSLTAGIVRSSVKMTSFSGIMSLHFTLHWAMKCTSGSPTELCEGTLTLAAPQQRANRKTGDPGYETTFVYTVRRETEADTTLAVDCGTECSRSEQGVEKLNLRSERGLGSPNERSLTSLPIVIERRCEGKKLKPLRLSIAFDDNGKVDLKKSKLR